MHNFIQAAILIDGFMSKGWQTCTRLVFRLVREESVVQSGYIFKNNDCIVCKVWLSGE